MAYSSYLIQIGSGNTAFTITGEKYIEKGSYKAVPKRQDVDPVRTVDGKLHRNVIEHAPLVVSFNTLSLTNTELGNLFGGIAANYLNELERKVLATAYVPELDEYVTQEMYLVEPEPMIDTINNKTGVIKYLPLKMEFIGY